MGGNDSYVSLCRKHFMHGEIFPNKWQDKNLVGFRSDFFDKFWLVSSYIFD
jgi:hypothetical protein